MSGDKKISIQVATDQFQEIVDHYDIDLDDLGENQKAAIEKAQKKIISSIMAGRLELMVGDDFKLLQRCKSGAVLTYRELDGKAKAAMGSRGENDNHGKIYAMMGSLSDVGYNGIAALKGSDLALAESLGLVFLVV